MIRMRFLFLTVAALFLVQECSGYTRLCYYTNWSQWRPEPHTFFPEDIDLSLCSHLVFAFAALVDGELAPYEFNDIEMYGRFTNLKLMNPSIQKILLAVGGWNFGTTNMTKMLATPEGRTHFVDTSVTYLQQYGFDGLDLDFEYPGSRGSPSQDKYLYTALVNELSAVFRQQNPPLMLGAAVGCGSDTIDQGYEIPQISAKLDFISLMAYDFNGYWDPQTGLSSPLRANDPNAPAEYQIRSLKWCADRWYNGGAPKNKMLIGVAAYGRGFNLTDPNKHDIYDLSKGPNKNGTWTREAGFWSYYETCVFNSQHGGTRVWTAEPYNVPYSYSGDHWIGYEDTESVAIKAQFIKDEGYAGYMLWSLDLDDHAVNSLKCNEGRYPIAHALNSVLGVVGPCSA